MLNQQDTGAASGRFVSFLTADSVHLRGTFWPGRDDDNIGLLLLHDWRSSREAWLPYIPAFRSRGYSILTFDLRGHGESIRQDMRATAIEPVETDLRSSHSYPTDVRAALAFLARQTNTDAARIASIGVGLGSDLAYAASGKGWGTASSVLVGLDDGRARELAGTGPFAPRSVYLLHASNDAMSVVSADNFKRVAHFPSETMVYPDSTATGINLVKERSPELLARAIAWIEKTV